MIYFVQVKLSALCLSAILACLSGALVKPVFWVWYLAQLDATSNDFTTVDYSNYYWLSADLMLYHAAIQCDSEMTTGSSHPILHCSHFLCGQILQISSGYHFRLLLHLLLSWVISIGCNIITLNPFLLQWHHHCSDFPLNDHPAAPWLLTTTIPFGICPLSMVNHHSQCFHLILRFATCLHRSLLIFAYFLVKTYVVYPSDIFFYKIINTSGFSITNHKSSSYTLLTSLLNATLLSHISFRAIHHG